MEKNLFSQIPALRMLLLVVVAFAAGSLADMTIKIFLTIILVSVILLIYLFKTGKKPAFYFIVCLLAGFCLSFSLNLDKTDIPKKIIPQFPALFQGKITKILSSDKNYIRCIAEGVLDPKPMPEIKGTVILLSVTGLSSRNLNLQPGSEIRSRIQIRIPKQRQFETDFPENMYAASIGVQWFGRAKAVDIAILSHRRNLDYYRYQIVSKLKNAIDRLFPVDIAPIIYALVLGDQSKISQETRKVYSLSGTAHVLSVSGLHTGIIAGILFMALGFIYNRWLKFILFAALLAVFVILTGMQPPAIRAAMMSVLAVLAGTLQRRVNPLNVISLSLLLIIIISPEMVYSVSFQMSAASMLGIVILYKPSRKFFSRLLKSEKQIVKYLISSLSLTFSASMIVTPLTAYYFSVFSLISFLTNIIVVPFMSLAMIFSLISLAIYPFSVNIASFYSTSASMLIDFSRFVNETAILIPFSYIRQNGILFLSITLPLLYLYLIFSNSYRMLLFRGCTAAVIIFSISFLSLSVVQTESRIIARENYVAAFIPLDNNRLFVMLADRKPKQFYSRDIAMEQYLAGIGSRLELGITGSVSSIIAYTVRKQRQILIYPLSHEDQQRIGKLAGCKYLQQYINL